MALAPPGDREGRLVELEEQTIRRGAQLTVDQRRDGRKGDGCAAGGARRELGGRAPRKQIDARRQILAEAREYRPEIRQRLTEPAPAVFVRAQTPFGRRRPARRLRAAERLERRLHSFPPVLAADGAVRRRGGPGHPFARPASIAVPR